ncbi:Type II secretory pathway, component ExeA (predicted ATPase) [Lutimaribacter pacificus]|uniref:Type II secretory pathway, component ExeA (Predicted ATPase) n=1 Tax=Lutimaribacter pacificus TaxID=391948 RepID=A0A1H0CN40_9RHOB|nr:AAA family ATPase [Lutimaribacter pacificus]SDN59254.1 Type II secretory pathway, component ExeA (predicted ATPase) [Lutimaribacter pacificus]SHJ42763.1 Type II secretory pathway, component ExeA (predicted ATPase) [Lutimaribacter pacificus]
MFWDSGSDVNTRADDRRGEVIHIADRGRPAPDPDVGPSSAGDQPVFRSQRGDPDAPHLRNGSTSRATPLEKAQKKVAASYTVDGGTDSGYREKMTGPLNIYTQHFGLSARPFTLVPDPDFLFWSAAHRRAYTMLEYGTLTGSPITLITGEVGAGKTTLLHKFLAGLGEGVKVGLISNAHGSRGELLRWVLMALDQPAERDATYVDLFDAFQKYLISEYATGNRVILIFDEAQNLSVETLEELRMFTNINSNKDELLQLVLVGQPELRDTIHRPELRQFAQRIAASFHLSAMDQETVTAYIGHRLRVAGAGRNLFTEAACHLIHEQTGGVPRLVNQLCDLSMVYAFTKNQKTVTLTTVEEVLADGTFFAAGSRPDLGSDI